MMRMGCARSTYVSSNKLSFKRKAIVHKRISDEPSGQIDATGWQWEVYYLLAVGGGGGGRREGTAQRNA